jgi:hypothetical protein
VVAASEDQVSSRLADETVILSLRTDIYFGLNEVGAFIWQRLQQQPQRVSELCEAIVETYAVSADTCREDVTKLLDGLIEQGLVSVRDDAQ